jgi:ABC-type antimicrobial peptide transport system permease subunit
MRDKLHFYLEHSLNDLRANGQRTIFALLCIAAGVGALVGMQTLGLMIRGTLNGNLQVRNGADIRIALNDDVDENVRLQGQTDGVIRHDPIFSDLISTEGVQKLRAWFDQHYPGQAQIVEQRSFPGLTGLSVDAPGSSSSFANYFIFEMQQYPLYGEIRTEDGTPLVNVFTAPSDVVVSRTLADRLSLRVGGLLNVSGAAQPFTVRGIVPDLAISDLNAILPGYYFLDARAIPLFAPQQAYSDTLLVKLTEPARADEISQAFGNAFPYLRTTTPTDVLKENEHTGASVEMLISLMGLLSLLLAGIGIVNTMQVVVGRRMGEIAILKVVGLASNEINQLFLIESLIMGLFGSAIGIVLGLGLVVVLRGLAEIFVSQPLVLTFSPIPIVTGLVIGTFVTVIFGLLPTLSAATVRPAVVLHAGEIALPRLGRGRAFVSLILVIFALSIAAQAIVPTLVKSPVTGVMIGTLLGLSAGLATVWNGDKTQRPVLVRIGRWLALIVGVPLLSAAFGLLFPTLIVVLGAFLVVGLLYLLLWILIWVISKVMPSFGSVDLGFAVQALGAQRGRGASTMLALAVGVFVLSLITLFAAGVRGLFERMVIDQTGGNVLVVGQEQGDTYTTLNALLPTLPGVQNYAIARGYGVEFISVQSARTGQVSTWDDIKQRFTALGQGGNIGTMKYYLDSIDARPSAQPLPNYKFLEGRQLTSTDVGQPVLVMGGTVGMATADIHAGDKITYRFTGRSGLLSLGTTSKTITFEIVGLTDFKLGSSNPVNSLNYGFIGSFPEDIQPNRVSVVANVPTDQVPTVRAALEKAAPVLVLETYVLNALLNAFIDQFTRFPTLVAALALFVGGVVIANSVALSMLERRRQIAILKALGVQRAQVLRMLLVENALLGLVGGLIGVGIALILLVVLESGVGSVSGLPILPAFGLLALSILIAILAAFASAWGASGEKPLEVLRYE